MRKKWIKFGSIGLAVAMTATLILMSIPASVTINQGGFLSVNSNVALAVNNPPESEPSGYSYTPAPQAYESYGNIPYTVVDFSETADYYRLDNDVFIINFYKGDYGYDTIYQTNGDVIAESNQLILQYQKNPTQWRDVGYAEGVDYEKVSDYEYQVTRHYTTGDNPPTTYDVTYTVTGNRDIKTSISITPGDIPGTQNYRLKWSIAGIKKDVYQEMGDSIWFEGELGQNLGVGWWDAANTFGDITTYEVTTETNGKKADVTFNVGQIDVGQILVIDPTLYEYYNTGANDWNFFYGTTWEAQIFTPSTTHKITSVKLQLNRSGSPGTLTVGIRGVDPNTNKPTGSDLCSGTYNTDAIDDSWPGTWYEITLGDGYDLSNSFQYAVVARVPDGNSSNKLDWNCDYSGTYTNGARNRSTNSGSNWVSQGNDDLMFENWGTLDGVQIENLRPDSHGDECNIDGETGCPACNDHYGCVDEVIADDSSTYVSTDSSSYLRDLYNIDDHITGSGTIDYITVYVSMSAYECADQDNFKIVINSGTGSGDPDTISEAEKTTGTGGGTWTFHTNQWSENPATTSAWTWDEIDRLQAGVALRSASSGHAWATRCSQVFVEVHFSEAPAEADISNLPISKAFGIIELNTSVWSDGSAPEFPLGDDECFFTITNNGDACSITIEATNFTGTGTDWTLGVPAENVVRMKAGKSGDANEEAMVTLTNSPQAFISGLVTTKKWEIKLDMPTSADKYEKTSTITLVATLD